MPVPVEPVPTEFAVDVARGPEGSPPMIALVASTQTGQQVYFMGLDEARNVANVIVELVNENDVPTLLRPSLIVPG